MALGLTSSLTEQNAQYIFVTLKCIFPATEELNKIEDKDGGDVYRETGVSKESVNVVNSAKLTHTDFMPVSHKGLIKEVGREQKRTKKVSKQPKSMKISTKDKHVNVEQTEDISSTKSIGDMSHLFVTPSGIVHDVKNTDAFVMEAMENHRSVRDSKITEQDTDTKLEPKEGDVERNHVKNQQKCYDSLYIEHKGIHDVASNSCCKRSQGDILQESCTKQNVGQVSKVKSSMETIKCKTPTDCTITAEYTSKAKNKQSQKVVSVGTDNFEKYTSPREKSHYGKEPEQKHEYFNLNNNKHQPEPACTDSSMVSCNKEEKEKSCENSCMHSKPLRTSTVVNLTVPNVLKKLKSTNMDKG
jgi:hypothetical protein